jgi:hypothetical protein
MSLRRKKAPPLTRAVADVERQLAALEREIRQLEQRQPQPAAGGAAQPAAAAGSPTATRAGLPEILRPAVSHVTPTYRARRVNLEWHDDPVAELEAAAAAEATVTRPATSSARFGVPADTTPVPPIPVATVLESTVDKDKLTRYLTATSRPKYTPRPQRASRPQRHRFWAWLGGAILTVWLIYVVVR